MDSSRDFAFLRNTPFMLISSSTVGTAIYRSVNLNKFLKSGSIGFIVINIGVIVVVALALAVVVVVILFVVVCCSRNRL